MRISDWSSDVCSSDLFQKYVDGTTKETPKGGFTLGGYRLVYGDTPGAITKAAEGSGKFTDQSFGIGLIVKNDGEISNVVWDSPAFKAGLALGSKIVGIHGARKRVGKGRGG